VASEVATTDFVRAHGVLTPRIPGYDISANLIDSEYILMEKLPGRPIQTHGLNYLNSSDSKFCMTLWGLDIKLFSMQLPASEASTTLEIWDQILPR
jgi:hypothetical protein